MTDRALRSHLVKLLTWQDAHAPFEAAVQSYPEPLRGVAPPGLPYSGWQLLEHMRLAQYDILDFCRNPDYQELEWPAGYWPEGSAPPSVLAWEQSIAAFQRDRAELVQIAERQPDLFARIPHGTGQTYLRELLLVVDHNAYHVAELVVVRRLLGIWPS